MSWEPQFPAAFTAASGGEARLADLHVTIAAALTAHALNVGYSPVVSRAPALTRSRIGHVDQNYLRAETYAAANAPLIVAQSGIELAQAWGGGPGRRGGRHPVRGAGPHDQRPAEPEILRAPARYDLACCACSASTTGPNWPTCPTPSCGASTRRPTTGH